MTPYVLYSRLRWRAALPVLLPALLGLGLWQAGHRAGLLACAVGVVAVLSRLRPTAVLRLEAAGLSVGLPDRHGDRLVVPWHDVDAVVVDRQASPPRVGVRLRVGAALPRGVRSVVHAPGGPLPTPWREVPMVHPPHLQRWLQASVPRVGYEEGRLT